MVKGMGWDVGEVGRYKGNEGEVGVVEGIEKDR